MIYSSARFPGMDRLRLFVYLSSIVSLNTCVASNAARQDGEVIRKYEGDIFTNPDDECKADSCNSVGGYCSEDCCICRCYRDKTTYIVHEKQCLSLESFRKLQKLDGKKDCRYWLYKKDSMGCSTVSIKIPLISLGSKGSVRLKMCHELKHLSNCALEEIKYMKQARWQTFGKKQSRLFKVTTLQGPQGSTNHLMLEWNRLDKEYDGIIGYMKITCKINGEQATLCFIFKSNKSDYVPTSQPFVATNGKEGHSTPTKVALPSSSTRSGGDSEQKKKDTKTNTIATAVSTSVVVFLLICVMIVAIFCWRRKKRKGTANRMGHFNSTYGAGPSNTLQLHGKGGAMKERQEGMKEYEDTYEMPADSGTKKWGDGRTTTSVGYSDTYETIDPASDSGYYYAKDVVSRIPEESENTTADHLYNVLENPNENVTEESQNQDGYNVITNNRTGGAKGNGKEMPHYDVLEREPVTDVRYQDDDNVYHYAN